MKERRKAACPQCPLMCVCVRTTPHRSALLTLSAPGRIRPSPPLSLSVSLTLQSLPSPLLLRPHVTWTNEEIRAAKLVDLSTDVVCVSSTPQFLPKAGTHRSPSGLSNSSDRDILFSAALMFFRIK